MRSFKVLVSDITHKPPVLFPLVGLFHILWFFWTIWDDRGAPFFGAERVQLLWSFGYTIFWLAACDLRKWGAMGYIFLTMLDAALYLAVRNNKFPELYVSNMFLLDGLFSFFLMFYYKKFR